MEIDTFRHWLSSAGAILTPRLITRGEEHGHLTIHREGRVAELPLTGLHHHLDAEMVRDVCEKLGLNASELPKGRP
jgi:mRNA interferase HicA